MIYMEKLILDKHEIWLLDFNSSVLTDRFVLMILFKNNCKMTVGAKLLYLFYNL